MTDAKLKNKDYMALKSLIGTNFISYECEQTSFNNRAYGNIGLNFDNKSIELINEQKPLKFFDTTEDIAYFELKELSSSNSFIPYIREEESRTIHINECILDIEIVEDIIKINDSYSITFDMAIIIKTAKNNYIFSKGWHFDEYIYITKNINFDSTYSTDKVAADWSDDETDANCAVTRKIISLAKF